MSGRWLTEYSTIGMPQFSTAVALLCKLRLRTLAMALPRSGLAPSSPPDQDGTNSGERRGVHLREASRRHTLGDVNGFILQSLQHVVEVGRSLWVGKVRWRTTLPSEGSAKLGARCGLREPAPGEQAQGEPLGRRGGSWLLTEAMNNPGKKGMSRPHIILLCKRRR